MCVNECVGGGGRSDVHETTSYSKEKRKTPCVNFGHSVPTHIVFYVHTTVEPPLSGLVIFFLKMSMSFKCAWTYKTCGTAVY